MRDFLGAQLQNVGLFLHSYKMWDSDGEKQHHHLPTTNNPNNTEIDAIFHLASVVSSRAICRHASSRTQQKSPLISTVLVATLALIVMWSGVENWSFDLLSYDTNDKISARFRTHIAPDKYTVIDDPRIQFL